MPKHNDRPVLLLESDNIPIKEVVRRVGVTASTIVRWVKKGAFPQPYTYNGRTFFSAEEIEDWQNEKKNNRGFHGTPPQRGNG